MEVFVQHLHKVVDRFQVTEIVIIHVNANAEVKTSISSVDDLKVPELWEECFLLVFSSDSLQENSPPRSLCAWRLEQSPLRELPRLASVSRHHQNPYTIWLVSSSRLGFGSE